MTIGDELFMKEKDYNPKLPINEEKTHLNNAEITDKQVVEKQNEKGCLMGCLFGVLAVIISMFVIVSVDGLSGFLTGIALILLILTIFFGPGVLAVAAILPILFLELYLFAYYPNIVFITIGILVLIWIIKVWKES